MSNYVPTALRRLVAQRASGLCEYCLLHESDGYFAFEVEHVIAAKHGGPTSADNLAYACITCNRNKGSDIASISSRTQSLTRLFNPRTHAWGEHFVMRGLRIEARTDIGEVSIRMLALNGPDRIAERELLAAAGRYPPPELAAYFGRQPKS